MATQNATDLDSRLTAGEVRYSTGAIILHWLLALAMGFPARDRFAVPHRGPHSFAPMQLHRSVGITVLLLTLIRLGWRLVCVAELPCPCDGGIARDVAPPAPAAIPVEDAPLVPEPTNLATTEAAQPPPEWTITGSKRLAFSVNNGGARVEGRFKDWSGSIRIGPDRPETADIRITIKLASASVGDATQDAML